MMELRVKVRIPADVIIDECDIVDAVIAVLHEQGVPEDYPLHFDFEAVDSFRLMAEDLRPV